MWHCCCSEEDANAEFTKVHTLINGHAEEKVAKIGDLLPEEELVGASQCALEEVAIADECGDPEKMHNPVKDSTIAAEDGSEEACFLVELKSTPGWGTGINISVHCERVIVTRVGPGMINDWNVVHGVSTRRVEIGDQIMSINGDAAVASEVMSIILKMNRAKTLRIKLRKPSRHNVQLTKDGDRLGLKLTDRFIDGFVPDGLFSQCLDAGSIVNVAIGDFILSVNGQTELDQMLRAFMTTGDLTLIIAHYESPISE